MPGLAPAIKTMRRAMRLCKFHFSTAAATQMTPTSSSVVFLKYSAATCGEGGKVSHQLGKGPWPVPCVLRARGWQRRNREASLFQIAGYFLPLASFSPGIKPRAFPMLGKHSTTNLHH